MVNTQLLTDQCAGCVTYSALLTDQCAGCVTYSAHDNSSSSAVILIKLFDAKGHVTT